MLEYFITSKTKRKLLGLLLTNPDRAFYTREIAKLTDEPVNAVRRELGHLEKAGLINPHKQGNLKFFSVIKEFPLYPELKRIIYATVGFGDYLANRFNSSKLIELAFIYGSTARDAETSKSDIDLFVIGEITDAELHELVSQIEKDTGRQINYTLMTKKEFDQRIKKGEPFIKRVMAEKKLIVKGNPDVYRATYQAR